MSLKEKIAVVTGAASGIGAATTRRLIAEGAKVLAVDINGDGLQSLVNELGSSAVPHIANLAVRAEVEGMVAAALDRFGALDILVNNAGIGSLGRAAALDPDEWRQVMAINLDAVFLASRAALPHLIARRGCIINTASISGMGADYGFTAYNTTKAAVINLTRVMALDYAARGVRVNAVSPGFISTPLVAMLPPALEDDFVTRIPMQRAGKPEEIASVITFLASADASFLTGQNIAVDGGITAHTGQPDVFGFIERMEELSQ